MKRLEKFEVFEKVMASTLTQNTKSFLSIGIIVYDAGLRLSYSFAAKSLWLAKPKSGVLHEVAIQNNYNFFSTTTHQIMSFIQWMAWILHRESFNTMQIRKPSTAMMSV